MVGWLRWLTATTFFFFFYILHTQKKSAFSRVLLSLHTLEVTTVTCLLPRTTGRTWEGACCEHGRAHTQQWGQGVLRPGRVVTALKSGTNTPALTSSSGVRTSVSVLLLFPPTEGNVVGELEGNGG